MNITLTVSEKKNIDNKNKQLQKDEAEFNRSNNRSSITVVKFQNLLFIWVDTILKVFFVLLLFLLVIISSINFGKEIFLSGNNKNEKSEIKNDLSYKNQKDNKVLINSNTENEKEKEKELNLLSFVEHTLIYLMPIFFVLGLFQYYMMNYSPIFTKTSMISQQINNAKESIQLTKTLFLSSIMSYIIIKIIEEIFFSQYLKELDNYIIYGSFLVIIMLYLIITHSKENHIQNS